MNNLNGCCLALLLLGTAVLNRAAPDKELEELEPQELLEDQVDYLTEAPRYSFEYSVQNNESGDVKKHQESREGDNVAVDRVYTITEPDGSTREVRYTADRYSGFKAVVTKIAKDGTKTEQSHGDHIPAP
ncbi:hypothetical protein AAG570_008673 [Ranatra chinensis]|uniref:Uncharacterized protein n=1 Tax=Ranatra chinensis TaxID=642074 RepID=A0ABD0YRV7_9HEMI